MENILELRDKGALTKSLVLIKLLQGKKKLREISSELEITLQGTSLYLKNLQKDGLIDKKLDLTTDGVAFLQRFLAALSNLVEMGYDETGIISKCEAIASGRINKEDKVFLKMNNGVLYASKESKSSSTGTALADAYKGDPITVGNLEGIIEVKKGMLFVLPVDLPDYYDGEKIGKFRRFVEENEISVAGAFGTIAKSFCDRGNVHSSTLAPVEICIEGTVKGMNSIIVYSPEMARFFFQKMSANINKYRINPKFVEL